MRKNIYGFNFKCVEKMKKIPLFVGENCGYKRKKIHGSFNDLIHLTLWLFN